MLQQSQVSSRAEVLLETKSVVDEIMDGLGFSRGPSIDDICAMVDLNPVRAMTIDESARRYFLKFGGQPTKQLPKRDMAAEYFRRFVYDGAAVDKPEPNPEPVFNWGMVMVPSMQDYQYRMERCAMEEYGRRRSRAYYYGRYDSGYSPYSFEMDMSPMPEPRQVRPGTICGICYKPGCMCPYGRVEIR